MDSCENEEKSIPSGRRRQIHQVERSDEQVVKTPLPYIEWDHPPSWRLDLENKFMVAVRFQREAFSSIPEGSQDNSRGSSGATTPGLSRGENPDLRGVAEPLANTASSRGDASSTPARVGPIFAS